LGKPLAHAAQQPCELLASDVAQLQRLWANAQKLISQGTATVHILPLRHSMIMRQNEEKAHSYGTQSQNKGHKTAFFTIFRQQVCREARRNYPLCDVIRLGYIGARL
jgi:hypothetical protein